MVLVSEDRAKGTAPTEDRPEDIKNHAKEGKWGYDLYPERQGEKYSPGLWKILSGEGRENTERIKCERNVYKCVKTSPLVKLMMGALRSSGCPIDIRRHISCEVCDPSVSGGYDPITNQIVVCQNMARGQGTVRIRSSSLIRI